MKITKNSLEYCQYTNICPSVLQKKSTYSAHRVRNCFVKKDVDVILSADETILRFHETTKNILALKGVKRVGVVLPVNEMNDYLVMRALDMFANITLPPFVIFIGVFCAYLLKQYKDVTNATVLFTDTHWMTSATNIIYFKYFSHFYRGKKLVLYMTKHLVIAVKL